MTKFDAAYKAYQQEIDKATDLLLELIDQKKIPDAVMVGACARIYTGLLFVADVSLEEFKNIAEGLKSDYALRFKEEDDQEKAKK